MKDTANFAEQSDDSNDFVSCGNYVGGHPDLDKFLWDVMLLRKQSDIEIYATYQDNSDPKFIKVFTGRQSHIPIASIMNINIEDRSARFSRLAVSSIGLQDLKGTGVQEGDQNTFLCIDWCNDNLNYSTLFQFASFKDADIARNRLINMCNTM